MSSLLDKPLQLSVLELLAEVYPAEVESPLLRPDHSNERRLRFNLMVLKAHGLVDLRPIDDADVPGGVQLARITPRGLAVLEGDWEPATDPAPLERLFEDSRPSGLRGVQPPPLPGYPSREVRDTPAAALRDLALETVSDVIHLVEYLARSGSRLLGREGHRLAGGATPPTAGERRIPRA